MMLAIVVASILLLVGLACRGLKFVQALFIPASVIGGLIGLLVFTLLPVDRLGATGAGMVVSLTAEFRSWPGPLIAVVFAGLLLGREGRHFDRTMRRALLAGLMVWIIILGEIAIGLVATWLFVLPTHDVPASFGQLIEAGFAGGHATAASLGDVFRSLDFEPGLDLGMLFATVGLVYGVISGIAFVNIGVRRGWARRRDAKLVLVSGIETRLKPETMAFARSRVDVLDPLALQVMLMALAVGVGMVLQWLFTWSTTLIPEGDLRDNLDNLPLFLFTLLGGMIVRRVLLLLRLDDLIDPASINRLIGVAMEFLIVAAIASLRIETVVAYWQPVVALLVAGFVWTGVCLLVLAPRLLHPDNWFELGILNYGMSTGTTAQGMMLLRIVDPKLESGAAEEYALAAPLSAPFIGGGIITFTLPVFLADQGLPVVTSVLITAVIILVVAARMLRATMLESPAAGTKG